MEMTVGKAQEERWRREWQRLHDDRHKNDYEIATLMSEIRTIFPKGVAGDTQFMLFVKPRFRPAHSDTLLQKALAFDKFTADQWYRFGGWPGISFLCGLTSSQRKHMLTVLTGKGQYNVISIRQMARKLGIVTKRQHGDRATYKNQILRTHLVALYRAHPELGTPPPEVAAALSSRKLNFSARAVSAQA